MRVNTKLTQWLMTVALNYTYRYTYCTRKVMYYLHTVKHQKFRVKIQLQVFKNYLRLSF